jgi:hypothetical protein
METRMLQLEERVERLHSEVSAGTQAIRELRNDSMAEFRERRSDLWTILYAGFLALIIILVWQVAGCSTLSSRQERLDSELTELRIAVDRASRSAHSADRNLEDVTRQLDRIVQNGPEHSDRIIQAMTARLDQSHRQRSQRSDAIRLETIERYDRLYEKLSEVQIAVARLANSQDKTSTRPHAADL